jgi:arylsulfatase A-like enzyme
MGVGGWRSVLVALVVSGGLLVGTVGSGATSGGGLRDVGDSAGSHPARAERVASPTADRPNIVVITSDDQSLSDLRWMPRTRRVLGDAGVTFSSMLSPHPLCCPARANLLTGQYAQNSGVRSNDGRLLGGFPALDPSHVLPVWLQGAGYRTAFVGKYLNGYENHLERVGDEPGGRQPGWTQWNPIVAHVDEYFGSTFYDNGARRTFARQHSSDVIRRYTGDYIRRFADKPQPFFVWAAHYAPHATCVGPPSQGCWQPAVPARRHAQLFERVRSPSFRDPAFNEKDMTDKPPEMRERPPVQEQRVQSHFLGRIRSLQAVDEAVADAVATLRDEGELDNTVVMFGSDNGMLMGEHRWMNKNLPYEEDLRVPLLVRGPGVPRNEVRHQTVSMIDIAPTVLDLADATASVVVDGRSFLPVLRDPRAPGGGTILIQAGPTTVAQSNGWGWSWRGVRTGRYTYVQHASGFGELYDRQRDPAQLRNVARRAAYQAIGAELQRRTGVLGDCVGVSCWPAWEPLPAPEFARQ